MNARTRTCADCREPIERDHAGRPVAAMRATKEGLIVWAHLHCERARIERAESVRLYRGEG